MKGYLKMDDELGKMLFGDPNANAKYKLLRERDGLTKYGREMGWIEWGEDGRYQDQFALCPLQSALLQGPKFQLVNLKNQLPLL